MPTKLSKSGLSVFDCSDYRQYLKVCLPTRGEKRGLRAKLARALGCNGAFISQVLNGNASFSLEHAVLIDEFLEHSPAESRFFMLLVHRGRAGTQKLQNYYFRQMQEIKRTRDSSLIDEKIRVRETLSSSAAVQYYSTWYYAAVHVLLLIPKYRTVDSISAHLRLSQKKVTDVLRFLASNGLAVRKGEQFIPTKKRIHLSNRSHLISKHHTNWRMQAIQSFDSGGVENIHYSGPIAVSNENVTKIKAILLGAIEQIEPALLEENEQQAMCLGVDLFQI